ncbi:MAG: Rab family GTPase [Promethearchaeota archaeon]|jgi:Ras-related protein Rab-11A
MTENSTKNIVIKLALLGDAGVGKTSLINQYTQHSFKEDYQPTLGVNIVVKELNIEELNLYLRLVLWDIAGQVKYDLSRKMFFQGCKGALLIYDVTRQSTFEDIKTKWLKDFQEFTEKKPAYLLIGNKKDLEEVKVVGEDSGKDLAKEINASDFIETSAKNGDNVENAFRKLVNQVLINSNLIDDSSK